MKFLSVVNESDDGGASAMFCVLEWMHKKGVSHYLPMKLWGVQTTIFVGCNFLNDRVTSWGPRVLLMLPLSLLQLLYAPTIWLLNATIFIEFFLHSFFPQTVYFLLLNRIFLRQDNLQNSSHVLIHSTFFILLFNNTVQYVYAVYYFPLYLMRGGITGVGFLIKQSLPKSFIIMMIDNGWGKCTCCYS